ncbi:hypothetical protein [Vallitalea okinawensis]|uniref:hypothetical protein n=1 Tax=Vallitalea okinawensis TaxID=2078660 RepID=UPI000CFBC3C1|nr:hypothetical protein [Vallitalea okinawensis]
MSSITQQIIKDNINMTQEGFQWRPKGRVATIYYVKNNAVLPILAEMSGSENFDVLVWGEIQYLNKSYDVVQNQYFYHSFRERLQIQRELINWLKVRGLRHDIKEMDKMINWVEKDNQLIIGDRVISFKDTIDSLEVTNEFIIVHLFNRTCSGVNMADQKVNNIFCLNYVGEIVWNIFDIIQKEDVWVSMMLDYNYNVVCTSFAGIQYTIDPMKKEVLQKVITK